MNSWQDVIGWFEIRAQNPLTPLLSFILFDYYYILTCVGWFSWQGIVVATFLTWVRVPGLLCLNIIFQYMFACSFNSKSIPYALQVKPSTRI